MMSMPKTRARTSIFRSVFTSTFNVSDCLATAIFNLHFCFRLNGSRGPVFLDLRLSVKEPCYSLQSYDYTAIMVENSTAPRRLRLVVNPQGAALVVVLGNSVELVHNSCLRLTTRLPYYIATPTSRPISE